MSNKLGYRKMRRKQYETVKKMDRQQFERFCQALYEEGQQSVMEKQTAIEFEDVRAAILEVKGIGEKRAAIIMDKLKEKIEGREQADEQSDFDGKTHQGS